MGNMTVDWSWVVAHGGDPDVRLVELDVSPAAYRAGHVPGAVLWNAYTDLRRPDYLPVGKAEFWKLLERSGVGPGTAVVFYGYAGALGYWLMRVHGHDNVRFVEGPRDGWLATGGQWEAEARAPVRREYPEPQIDLRLLARRDELEAARHDPETLVLDMRSPEEYSGETFWPSGATEDVGRAGHMPGAVSVPIDSIRRPDGAIAGRAQINKVFDQAGAGEAKRVITYCTIGNRASQAWVALTRDYGHHNAAVYHGSWVEWGKRSDTAIEI